MKRQDKTRKQDKSIHSQAGSHYLIGVTRNKTKNLKMLTNMDYSKDSIK